MTNTDLAGHWGARLAEHAVAERVPGAVLGLWAGGEQILAAHGVLSTSTQVAVTPGAVFQIGSITKPWTATMIMQLAEEGRLSLDATVADVLPGVRIGADDASAEITVRHLLNHTSGIDGDLFTDTGRGDDCVGRYVAGLADAALISPPGAAYSYCNSGFVLLGRMIEVLDGRVWDESLRQRLIRPLGLGSTVTLPEEAILFRASVGHRGRPRDQEAVAVWVLARALGPAGLITASASDVLTFSRMHLDGGVAPSGTRLLSEASAAAMREETVRLPSVGSKADAVGLGWRLDRWGGRAIFGHDGGTIGQTAYLRIDPEAGLAACLLTNAADGTGLFRKLFAEVFAEFCGVSLPAELVPVTGAADGGLARHVGVYERSSRRVEVLVRDDGSLHAVFLTTGPLGELNESRPEDLDLYPADSAGNNFVFRSCDGEPWVPLSFGNLDDGRAYLYSGGRITLRTGDGR
jgi:CubicO group peptidase (beta-lactamase class C family)